MADVALSSLKAWFQREAAKEAKKDVLKRSDRWGGLIGMIGIVIVLIFFASHLASRTGFFTVDFGAASAILFFGASAWGLIASGIRFVTGKKSPAKPFDIIGSVIVFISLLYFLASFQFNFSHIADVLPDFLKWALQWITDDFAKGLMVLATVVLLFVIPYQVVSYRYLRIEMSKPQEVPASIAGPAQNEEAPKQ